MLRDSPKTGSITHSAPTVRTRNYATIVYPESAPPDWMEKLSDAHIPALVSPLHDKDTTADGELKKPHYHVQLLFQSVKSHRQVEAIVAEFGGVGVEVVQDAKAYARYLIHMDHPDKAQYDAQDIVELSGVSFSALTHLKKDELNTLRDMMEYIRINQIDSFAVFADACASAEDDTWLKLISFSRAAYFLKQYISSISWGQRNKF